MNSSDVLRHFLQYRQELAVNLESNPAVLGLVFVGSAADTSRVDRWSDHDFFVITQEGEAEGFRTNLEWLPNHQEIVIRTRETAHGLKVIYSDGHVLEFAVFNDHELELAGANDFAVFIDRQNIQARMQAIAAKSLPAEFNPVAEFELFLAHVLIGVGRFRRGEVLIAGQQIRSYSLSHVVGLIKFWQQPQTGTQGLEDNLNRFRRFEKQYPVQAAAIEAALQTNVEACAQALLGLLLEQGSNWLTPTQLEQVAVIERTLDWAQHH